MLQHAHALEILKDHLYEGARALDVGSGSGYLTACMGYMVCIVFTCLLICSSVCLCIVLAGDYILWLTAYEKNIKYSHTS